MPDASPKSGSDRAGEGSEAGSGDKAFKHSSATNNINLNPRRAPFEFLYRLAFKLGFAKKIFTTIMHRQLDFHLYAVMVMNRREDMRLPGIDRTTLGCDIAAAAKVVSRDGSFSSP